MASLFDRIVVTVPDLPTAVAQYQQLLGVVPFLCTTAEGAPAAWVGLPNTVIELVPGAVEHALISGLVLSSPAGRDGDAPVTNRLQLDISICNGLQTRDFRRLQPEAQSAELLVDHLVLRTDGAQACIDLFARDLGIRLALDKTVPEWGGRMLFFRAGKLTLEVIESPGDQVSGNSFWGIAYQCHSLELESRRLVERGVALSGIRDGRKPGTRVATIKSHGLGIPTLLIEPVT